MRTRKAVGRSRRGAVAALAVAAAVLAVAGCGDGTPDGVELTSGPRAAVPGGADRIAPATTSTTTAPPAPASPGAAAALRAALERSRSQPTVRTTLTMEMPDPVGSIVTESSGTSDGRVQTGVTEVPGAGQVPFRIVDGTMYYAFPGLPAGTAWVSLDSDQFEAMTGMDLQALVEQQDPFGPLQDLSFLDGAREVGAGTVDGRPATEYEVDAELAELFDRVAGAGVLSGTAAADATRAFGPTTTLHYWVDDTGLLVHQRYELDIVAAAAGFDVSMIGESIGYDVVFDRYGEPIDVTAPDPATVMSFDEFRAERD
ncbi:hypothetical protein [Dermatobacter hominis]|uniref:hypothetical protein n=1 Tax=Dermatobacter hominis TaxID=2884263 RepID=UPI001D12C6C6|nr:hypothetical protein [Dermatobacter hominis]UDY37262.1 hypothetical protein LH044_06915 [Dermatobacter hominis]